MDFAAIRTMRDEIWIDSMAKKLSSSFPTCTTMPGTGAPSTSSLSPSTSRRQKKIKPKTATIELLGALTHVLDGQEMPTSDLNVSNDLKNVFDDPKANQKSPKS